MPVGKLDGLCKPSHPKGLEKQPPLDELTLGRCRCTRKQERAVVSTSLPFFIQNSVLPRWDVNDGEFTLLGATKRAAFRPPEVKEDVKKEFREFCLEEIKKIFQPIDEESWDPFNEWLESMDYSEARKTEIRVAYDNYLETGKLDDAVRIGSFLKDECTEELKAPRWINARDDAAKAVLGPFFQKITDQFAKLPEVIKTVPVEDRPKYLDEMFGSFDVLVSSKDFTSFEAHFLSWIMEIEAECYQYVYGNYSKYHTVLKFMNYIQGRYIGGEGYCMNNLSMRKWGSLLVRAKRMSGEMNTSLGNTLINLLVIRFIAHKKKASVTCAVEGDDSLSRWFPPEATPTIEEYNELGWKVKDCRFLKPGDASFCGNVYDYEDLEVVKDPIYILSSLGWLNRKWSGAKHGVRMQLLRAKVLSMAHQYGRCPIIWAASKRLLELTSEVKIRTKLLYYFYDSYHISEGLRHAKETPKVKPPGQNSRHLVERMYGISLSDQYRLESQLLQCTLQPFLVDDHLVRPTWSMIAQDFVGDEYHQPPEPEGNRPYWLQEMRRVYEEASTDLLEQYENWLLTYGGPQAVDLSRYGKALPQGGY